MEWSASTSPASARSSCATVYSASRLVAVVAALAFASGCKSTARPPPARAGECWRDQLLFFSESAVLVFGVHRDGRGEIEVKGWLGVEGRWRALLYETAPLDPRHAPSLEESVAEFADRPHRAPLRLDLVRRGETVVAHLRTATSALALESDALAPVEETRDPEGVVRWSAGPAELSLDGHAATGTLLAEETAPDRPLRAEIDYGDFAMVAARLADGELVVGKTSRGAPGFDHLTRIADGKAMPFAPRFSVDTAGARIDLPAPVLLLALDRTGSEGVTSAGLARRYEALLLGGPAGAGVAFRIAPAVKTHPRRRAATPPRPPSRAARARRSPTGGGSARSPR